MTITIFAKTPKGIEEVETKANGLSRLERSVLIYIDGKRTTEDLKVLPRVSEELSTILGALETGGYIMLLSATATNPTPKPVALTAPRPASAPGSDIMPAKSGIFRELPAKFEPEKFNMAKHFMINTLNFFKGQYGATSLVRSIDLCQTHEDLRTHFDIWHEVITSTKQGQKQERELREKLLAVL